MMLKDLWLVLTKQLSSATQEAAVARYQYTVRAYEENVRTSEIEITRLANDRVQLTQLVMEIDEQLFRMSQLQSWEAMRPIFADLIAKAATRRKHVSDRVGEREIARIRSEAGQ